MSAAKPSRASKTTRASKPSKARDTEPSHSTSHPSASAGNPSASVGNPSTSTGSIVRTYFSRGEQVMGLLWLSLGALLSVLLETVYLSTWITLGSLRIPFPYTIVIAFLFNLVLTRTALLWSRNPLVAAIPTLVWLAGYFLILILGLPDNSMFLGPSLRTFFLLGAGIAGGLWPIFRTQ